MKAKIGAAQKLCRNRPVVVVRDKPGNATRYFHHRPIIQKTTPSISPSLFPFIRRSSVTIDGGFRPGEGLPVLFLPYPGAGKSENIEAAIPNQSRNAISADQPPSFSPHVYTIIFSPPPTGCYVMEGEGKSFPRCYFSFFLTPFFLV